jgi:hypothetical protein
MEQDFADEKLKQVQYLPKEKKRYQKYAQHTLKKN